MSSKTYVSAGISALAGDTLEWRFALTAEAESTCKDVNMIRNLHENTLMPGSGVKLRNFTKWATRKQSYINFLKEKSYNEFIGWSTPWIVQIPEVSEDEVTELIQRYIDDYSTEETDEGTKTITLKAKDSSGNIVNKSITTSVKSRWKYVQSAHYCQPFDVKLGAECGLLYDPEQPYWDKAYWFTITGEQSYLILDSSATDDEGNSYGITNTQAILEVGTTSYEPHTRPDGTSYTETVFLPDDDHDILDVGKALGTTQGNFLYLSYYVYKEYVIDAYKTKDGYLELDDSGSPIPIDGDHMIRQFYYEQTKDEYNGVNKYSYLSPIDKDDLTPIGIALPQAEVQKDELLKKFYGEPVNQQDLIPPPVCLRYDKSWRDRGDWEQLNNKTLKKMFGSRKAYGQIMDNLYSADGIGDANYVYIFNAIPCNLGQLDYVGRYFIQLVKQYAVPNWQNIKIGSGYYHRGGRVDIGATSNPYNFRMYWRWSSSWYSTAPGPNPINPKARPGQCGYGWYNGTPSWYRQYTANSYEMVGISGYGSGLLNIKNGKDYNWTNAEFGKVVHPNNSPAVTKYAEVTVPILQSVMNHISINDLTDLAQYTGVLIYSAYKVVKKKWYQTGLFQIVVLIVVIVINIYSGGTTTQLTVSTIASMAATVLIQLLIQIAISMVVAVVVNAIVAPVLKDLLGDFLGGLISNMIIMVVSYYCGQAAMSSNYIQGMDATLGTQVGAGANSSLIDFSNWGNISLGAAKGVLEIYNYKNQYDLQKTQQAMKDLQAQAQAQQDALDQAKINEFSGNSDQALAIFQSMNQPLNETPEQNIQRVLYLDNTIQGSLSIVYMFVSMSILSKLDLLN